MQQRGPYMQPQANTIEYKNNNIQALLYIIGFKIKKQLIMWI